MKSYETTRTKYRYHYSTQAHKYSTNSSYRDNPILHEIFLSLEELSSGCTKKMKIAAKIFDEHFEVVRIEEKIVKFEVPAGAKDGTRVIIPSAGNIKPGTIPGDVIFVIRERKHTSFSRDEENNLIHNVNITLREALTGCNIVMKLPCGESLNLCTRDIVTHGICKRIQGKGMPRSGKNRGDLLVNFSVIFPVKLTEEQKDKIRSILS